MVNQIAKWGKGAFNTCDEPNRQRGGTFQMYTIYRNHSHMRSHIIAFGIRMLR